MRTFFWFFSTRRTHSNAAAIALGVFLALTASACGGSDDVDAAADAQPDTSQAASSQPQATNTDAAETESNSAEAEAPAAEPTPEDTEDVSVDQGTFQLVLENGEMFSAPVFCVLEPQIAAGSEILFTANGTADGLFVDVTQWGETAFGGSQDVEVVDSSTFDSLWRATGSTGLELELSGNTITGSGGFYPGEELNGPKTQGELTVSC